MTIAVLDRPPVDVGNQLRALATRLDELVPPKLLDANLLIATWNIRAFGDLTEKWHSEPGDSPRRDFAALRAIALIVARFDVIAVQEVKGNIKALRHLMKILGPDWCFILTDVTRGAAGNNERMAFIFDTRRVKPSGLACELVVPEDWLSEIEPGALQRQFARTPYAASFITGNSTFILVALHVLYGDASSDRTSELRAIARWMAEWAKQEDSWGHNLITLGDFNIDRQGDPNYEAFTSTGLRPPKELDAVPRTIFDEGKDKHYDQIAWFCGEGDVPMLSMMYTGRGGGFDFVPELLGSLSKIDLSWTVSDHYPLWAEFSTRT